MYLFENNDCNMHVICHYTICYSSIYCTSTSGMATLVPSSVKGRKKSLNVYGTMSLKEELQPAIEVAEKGVIADKNYIRETAENAQRFKKFHSTKSVYLNDDGSVPEVGILMKEHLPKDQTIQIIQDLAFAR